LGSGEGSRPPRKALARRGNELSLGSAAGRRRAEAYRSKLRPQASVVVSPLSERPGKKILTAKSGEERIGQVSLTPIDNVQKGAYEVSTSQIKPSFRREGKGKEMYRQVIDYAKKTGATALYSDDQMSPEAKGVWDSLSKEFPVTKEGGRYKIDLNTPLKSASLKEPASVKALNVQRAQNAKRKKP
jgi:predicted GNAT family acetyltransferase